MAELRVSKTMPWSDARELIQKNAPEGFHVSNVELAENYTGPSASSST